MGKPDRNPIFGGGLCQLNLLLALVYGGDVMRDTIGFSLSRYAFYASILYSFAPQVTR